LFLASSSPARWAPIDDGSNKFKRSESVISLASGPLSHKSTIGGTRDLLSEVVSDDGGGPISGGVNDDDDDTDGSNGCARA